MMIKDQISVVIGGDVSPTKRDRELWLNGDDASLFGDYADKFRHADVGIINLETPIISQRSPIPKSGAVFDAPMEMASTLAKAGLTHICLANNHIKDHGERGVRTTIEALKVSGLEVFGAGTSLSEASEVYSALIKGVRLSIFAYAEHEFSLATPDSGGANPLDLIDFSSKITGVRQESDFVLLLFHGGKEHSWLPSPEQQRICRFFIEMGVDAVVCQHSHRIGLIEDWGKGKIIYGQGNFLFDPYPDKRTWLYKGFGISLQIAAGGRWSIEYVPHQHRSIESGSSRGIEILESRLHDEFLSDLSRMTDLYRDSPSLIDTEWRKLARDSRQTYLGVTKGHGRAYRKFSQIFPWFTAKYSESERLLLTNIVRCQTHRELLLEILNDND